MGINSTEVAYGFGQLGSAFADASANTITPPEGQCIIAIQFLADTELSALVSKDTSKYPGIGSTANSTGTYTRVVDGATTSSQNVVFTAENAGSGNNDNIVVGDEVYIASTGASLGTVSAIDVGSNTKQISFSASATSLSNSITISFIKPNKTGHRGVGGMAIDSSNTFPTGSTIFGRWDSVSLNDNAGVIIAYFGE